jgi:nitroreductase
MRGVSIQLARLLVGLLLLSPVLGRAQERTPLALPSPQMEGGTPLMQALKARRSSREFRPEPLPVQMLSNLLWAAFGINRPESGGRTAPSAHNGQEIDIYVATTAGLFLFDAKTHALQPILSQDIRALTGTQGYVPQAPVQLVYVADFSRMGQTTSETDKHFYAPADTGFISQNVYLYCASEGLATVVRESIDKPVLAATMQLRPEQQIILAQSVGYPKR